MKTLTLILVVLFFLAGVVIADDSEWKIGVDWKTDPKTGAMTAPTEREGFTGGGGIKEKQRMDSRTTTVLAYAEVYIKQLLKAPATAVFDREWMARSLEKIGSNTFRIKCYVDSQNSFGALIRTHFDITIENVSGDGQQFSDWKVVKIVTSP